jgi:hypothetical protein
MMRRTIVELNHCSFIARVKVDIRIGTTIYFAFSMKFEYNWLISVNDGAMPCSALWFHNDCKVLPSERCLIAGGGGGGMKSCEFVLELKSLDISDDGVWSVAIRNGLGTVEDQCRLTLKGR